MVWHLLHSSVSLGVTSIIHTIIYTQVDPRRFKVHRLAEVVLAKCEIHKEIISNAIVEI